MCDFGQKAFIFYGFLKTAKNIFIKMNGFGGFWAKVDENEWLLSKSKIREKRSREVATKAQRHEEREEFLATNERELTRINKREEEFRIQNAEEKKKKKYNRREFNHEETKSTKKRRK